MPPDLPTKPGYHTWELHARPIGAKHEPWRVTRVEARSMIQADAILRRNGYEVAIQTAMQVTAQPITTRPAILQPLVCARCDYQLTGLIIESASVICPECSYPQPLVAWNPDILGNPEKAHPVLWLFAIIGVIATIIFGILFITAMMFS
jgi:hypothetical protein